jgi:hypothetical protein
MTYFFLTHYRARPIQQELCVRIVISAYAMALDKFLTFLFLGPRPSLAASWPAPLVCDVIRRSRKRIKTSKSQSCRVTAGNGETSNGTPLGVASLITTGVHETLDVHPAVFEISNGFKIKLTNQTNRNIYISDRGTDWLQGRYFRQAASTRSAPP